MIKNILKDKYYEINIKINTIHIINYISIENLTFKKIKIKLYDKFLLIIGKNMIINKLDENELIINGIFEGIDFIDE